MSLDVAIAPPHPGRWRRLLGSDYFILLISALYFLALAPFIPGFATPENLRNLLANSLPLLVVAAGQTVVLIAGGIDLSVTAIMAATSVQGALVMQRMPNHGLLATVTGVAAMLGIGAVVGGGNGMAITRLRMPPFIVTLTAMMFFSGFAVWVTQSQKINGLPEDFNNLGGKLPFTLAASLLAVGLLGWLLRRSLFGAWLYAVGHNPRTARVSGVPVDGVLVGAYVLSGLGAALASVLLTGQGETGDPVLGRYLLLDVIGASVIGGASFFGGRGNVLSTAAGVLFIKLIDNSLGLLGSSHFTIMMVKGCLILAAALADSLRHRLVAAN